MFHWLIQVMWALTGESNFQFIIGEPNVFFHSDSKGTNTSVVAIFLF